MIKDMMPNFELYQPTKLEDALALAKRHGKDGWLMAGGKDSLDWFKDRIKRPKAVIDLEGIEELYGIRETSDGIEIGALTKLADIERSPVIKAKFGLLSEAAGKVASPQIRNAGTLSGNISQDTRCWYYRDGLNCYRAGGNTCFADTPTAMNREHAIFGANRCVAVTPSDTGPALVALEAKIVISGPKGERVVDAEDYFIGPAVDITRMTVLGPDDIVTAIRIPNTWAGAKFHYEKITDRNAWDFPLVNIAAAAVVNGGTIEKIRVVAGGIEATPRRLKVVEGVLTGQAATEENGALAGQSAIRGAKPLNFNHFKVPLLANLVKRAVRSMA